MFANGSLYYATGSSNDLFRTTFRDGRPVSGSSRKVVEYD
jgi:hypothetical protein